MVFYGGKRERVIFYKYLVKREVGGVVGESNPVLGTGVLSRLVRVGGAGGGIIERQPSHYYNSGK